MYIHVYAWANAPENGRVQDSVQVDAVKTAPNFSSVGLLLTRRRVDSQSGSRDSHCDATW